LILCRPYLPLAQNCKQGKCATLKRGFLLSCPDSSFAVDIQSNKVSPRLVAVNYNPNRTCVAKSCNYDLELNRKGTRYNKYEKELPKRKKKRKKAK
jgi:hypothetical protein